MELKNFFAQDTKGNVVPFATVTVYNQGTTVRPTLYGPDGTAITNPFNVGNTGLAQFRAANGEYDVKVITDDGEYTLTMQCNDVNDSVAAAAGEADRAETEADRAEQAVIDGTQEAQQLATTQANRSESEADRAETARDAATVNADAYADTASGLAATSDGDQFQVVSENEIIRYKNATGSAVEVARYPSAANISDQLFYERQLPLYEYLYPNRMTSNQVGFTVLPSVVGNAVLTVVETETGPALKLTSAAVGDYVRVYWRIPASQFTKGTISASLSILSANSGVAGGSIKVVQRDGTSSINSTTLMPSNDTAQSLSRITTVREAGINLDPTADYVDLDVDFRAPSDQIREVVIQAPMLADGGPSSFRSQRSKLNYDEFASTIHSTTNIEPIILQEGAESVSSSDGDIELYPERTINGVGVSALVSASLSSGETGIVKLPDGPLIDGEVIRGELTVEDIASNPSVGLAFGTAQGALGYALRYNGQNIYITMPDGLTGGVIGPDSGGFIAGETLSVDARLLEGQPGDYTVRFYVEKEGGKRYGPYDVEGIASLDEIWLMVRGGTTISGARFSRHRKSHFLSEFIAESPAISGRAVHVSTTGDDANAGTSSFPFATFSRAVSALPSSGGVIEIAGGEYRETLDISGISGRVVVKAPPYERVTILGSDELTLTKTDGYTQVYDAALANKPTGMEGGRGPAMIFEHGTPSKPIPDAERHDLQRGETHRLPFTEMLEAASIAELDTVDGQGKWYWENGTIYLAATDGSDATTKRYETRVRSSVIADNCGIVELYRIDCLYSSSYGMQFDGTLHVKRYECRAFGSYSSGFEDDAQFTESFRDEAAANGNDGFNGHAQSGYDSTGNREGTYLGIYHDPWGHDNYDDGHSYHERGECTIYGGLFEHNSKAGVVHVSGASTACYHTLCRGAAHGFYASTTPLDNRTNATLRCHNTVATGNIYNYRSRGNAVLLAFDCVSRDADNAGYQGDGDSGSKLQANNCRHSGSGTPTGGDWVEIINDALLS